MNGIIWRKQKQEFVQLFSILQFAALRKENLAKRRAIEMQDMSGEVMKAVYYKKINMIMFHDNDTKVNSIYGDMWHLFVDYLNSTLIPLRTTDYNFGKLESGTLNDLVGKLAQNKAQAIMINNGLYSIRLDFIDYTMSLWKSSERCKYLCETTVIPGYVECCPSSGIMNGVIWSKMKQSFVPISSVPVFAMMQQERLRQTRALETHNFQLWNLTLTSFQEAHFFEFYDNDMKVTGLCGELWNLLSEKLNFTLQLVRSNENGLGASEKNQTIFTRGLLGIISRNETIAIPKVETYPVRLLAADFTIPLWMNSQRLYIQNEIIYDSMWMTKVFSWKVWCSMLVMFLLLSVCSFWSQTVLARIRNNSKPSTIGDHIFYNFGMICNQSYIPSVLTGRSRILETSMSLFCSILSMSFGALLYIYITKRISITPPFNSLDSMLIDTTYSVVTLKNSIGDIAFKVSAIPHFTRVRTAKRAVVASTIEKMFKLACVKGKKKYIIFQGEDEYKTRGKIGCYVTPIVGESYLKMWVASGIARNFKYKRTIDLGILRLKEVGLLDVLQNRWMVEKREDYSDLKAESIEIDQVFLVILIMCCGMIIAFIIFIIEKVVYIYKLKSS